MPDRPRLALAIPTFRRAAVVAENLASMAEELRTLGVAVYLSDDSPDEATKTVAYDLAEALPRLHYRRNVPALGHDANLIATMCWPNADYVWLMGDALRVKPGHLTRIVDFLTNQDMLFVRCNSPDDRMIPELRGADALTFLRDALWQQTMTGATIYSRRVCDWVRDQGAGLAVKRNFPQLSVILGFASAKAPTIGWFGDHSFEAGRKQSYWRERAVSVFVDDWIGVVTAFPAVVPPSSQPSVIRSHSAGTKLFDRQMLVSLKPSGEFSWSSLWRPHFLTAMHLPAWQIVALLMLPTTAFSAIQRVKRSLGRMMRFGLID